MIPFNLRTAELIPEPEALNTIDYLFAQDPGTYLDIGSPKPFGEVLLLGLCSREPDPDLDEQQPWYIEVEVGSIYRNAIVSGIRFWKKDQGQIILTDPEPLYNILLTPENAFGGADFPTNPRGRGFNAAKRLQEKEHEAILLPSVEDPAFIIHSIEDCPPPVWFSHTPLDFPERQKLAGTFDDAWFQEVHPALPEDCDPSYYNDAQPELWIPTEPNFFQGGEKLKLTGVVTTGPIEGYLPRYRVRQFYLLDAPQEPMQEITTRFDSVVLIPAHDLGFCCYRGRSPIFDDDPFGLKVKSLATAFESQDDEPKTFKHYEAFIKRRITGVGTIADYEDTALSPLQTPEQIAAQKAQEVQQQQANLAEFNQRQSAIEDYAKEKAGIDKMPDNPYAEENSDPRIKQFQERALALADPVNIPNEIEAFEFESLLNEFTGEQISERMEEVPEEYRDRLKPPDLPRHPDLLQEEIAQRLSKPQSSQIEKHMQTAIKEIDQLEEEQLSKILQARRISPSPVTVWLEMIEKDRLVFGKAMAQATTHTKHFKDLDLADVHILDHTFTDNTFIGCFFERSIFERCRFERCDFTDATFVQARFTDTVFVDCTFVRTNLSNTEWNACQVQDFIWQEMYPHKLTWTNVILLRGTVSDCIINTVNSTNLQVEEVEWEKCQLVEWKTVDAKWHKITLNDVTFITLDWTKVHVDTLSAKKVFFMGIEAQNAVFKQCEVTDLFVVGKSNFTGTQFTGIIGQKCGWREAVFHDVIMTDCRFIENDFSDADMSRIQADEIVFTESRFMGTLLNNAQLVNAHLFKCNLQQTNFTAANLTRACLFEATLDETIFDEAKVEFADFRRTVLDHKGKVPSTAISS
jgi:uncharacterized protein YjbI with pentapeptide repeats